ncbi:MAG: ATP-binding protein [Verrucomicrobium sp.]|nr:GAF domain-containing sensor histidine kinase [Verrucomicrobium sp.]
MSDSRSLQARVEFLRTIGIHDGSRTFPSFDRVCNVVVHTLGVPVSLASFVAEDRQIFAGMAGSIPEPFGSARTTPLTHSICQYVVQDGQTLVIHDVRHEPWHAENLACTDLKVRSYLGVPLINDQGLTIGSLCALDDQPREWTRTNEQVLTSLAAMVMTEISLLTTQSSLAVELRRSTEVRQRKEAKTRSLVHDLRTPLNNLLLGMQLLNEIGELNGEQAEVLEMSMTSGQNLSSLLNRILEADLAAMATAPTAVGELAGEAVSQVLALAQARRHQLSLDLQVGVEVSVNCHRGDLLRAIVNLLGNAIKYTPECGEVTLSVREAAGNVVFEVIDNGKGIPSHEIGHVFEAGFRASNAHENAEGHGLGLVLVKDVVQNHGGQIYVTSKLGAGTTFTVKLPLCAP